MSKKYPLLFSLLLVLFFAWIKIPRKTDSISDGSPSTFPTVTGTNLNRQDKIYPADLPTELTIIFIAFQQWQQNTVNGWVPAVQEIEAANPAVSYLEFPTVWEMTAARRTFLNEGMRAGIPDPTSRERTITLYLDKPTFKEKLDIPNEDQIVILLVKQDGTILWRTEGAVTDEKTASLQQAIKNSMIK